MTKRSAPRGSALKGHSDASSSLPVRQIIGVNGTRYIAVHISGNVDDKRLPLICIADYCRNMMDFAGFVGQFRRHSESDWPTILIDLPGHGRSENRQNPNRYTTTNDAQDVATIVGALGIEKALFLGQGYGGQVIMALASQHCHLIAGTILIDASPMINAPGLVRMRDNMLMMLSMRNRKQFISIGHQVLADPILAPHLRNLTKSLAAHLTGARQLGTNLFGTNFFGARPIERSPNLIFAY